MDKVYSPYLNWLEDFTYNGRVPGSSPGGEMSYERKNMKGLGVPWGFINSFKNEIFTPSNIPNESGYIIQFFNEESVYIPGDERSRQSPGHGYPEETRVYKTVRQFFIHTKENLELALGSIYAVDVNRKDVAVLEVNPVRITPKIEVTF